MDNIFIYAKPSSLKIKEARITEIACIRTNGYIGKTTKKSVVAAFTTKISGDYTFKNALSNIKSNITDKGDKYVVITYLSDLVRTLVRSECDRANETEELFSGRAWIDVAQLAWPLIINGMIESRSIESLCKHFKIALENKDDTTDICTAIVCVYGCMMRRYKTALAGEEVIRDIGGEALENIRKMVGF